MSKKGETTKQCPETPKKSFKGIENFLRRVAFNLGNSPSQTEVKIISCIPIDVTDLQQKINHLERQLEERKEVAQSCCRVQHPYRMTMHAAMMTPHTGVSESSVPSPSSPSCTLFAPPGTSPQLPPPKCTRKKSAVSLTTPKQKIKLIQSHKEQRSSTSIDIEHRKKNLFKRYRKPRNSALVYYAQTTSSPFTNHVKEIAARREMRRMDTKVQYVDELLRKQYIPDVYEEQWSGASSQASAPVCRDSREPPPAPHAPDACSCCRGRFHDIDLDYRPTLFLDDSLSTNMHRNVDSGNIFYNSAYYDIFPVKEKLDKEKKEDKFKKREQTFQFDDSFFRKTYKTNVECRSALTNSRLTSTPRCANKTPSSGKWRDNSPKRLLSTNESSGNTMVGCIDMFMNQSVSKKHRRKVANKTVLVKNVECFTHNVNDNECQTESSKNIRPQGTDTVEENQTETTLNQIKSILQSVLSHVKTSNQIKAQTDKKEKKDAIVQNELQPNSAVCSRLLNSYTYSQYSVDPRQPAAGPPLVMPLHPAPTTHLTCMKNFPVFVQHTPPPRQYFGCRQPRPEVDSHLIQTSANKLFPPEPKRSKETDTLIKEIYESMALNIPKTPPSNSEKDETKPRNVSTIVSGDPVISNMITMGRQVGPRAPGEAARSRAASAATPSRAATSASSARASRSVRGGAGERPLRRPDTVAHSQSPSDDTESDSDSTAVPTEESVKETKKSSIFKKVFRSVFKRRRKIKRSEDRASSVAESESENESDSDSDGYQTVSSQVERPKRVTYAPARDEPPRDPRREPYMEQEYRRYWDEQLMFQRAQAQDTTQAPSRPRSVRSRPPGIYFHKCEARPVKIDQPSPFQPEPASEPEQAAPPPRRRRNVSLKVSNKKSWSKKQPPKVKCAERWTRLMLDGC